MVQGYYDETICNYIISNIDEIISIVLFRVLQILIN